MKTITLRLGTFITALWKRDTACARSSLSTLSVTKSVSGLPGSWLGHCTSPTLRRAAGGSDTVISAKAGLPRSPENRMPASSSGARVVATSMVTLLVSEADELTGRSTPFTSPAQPVSTKAAAPAQKSRSLALWRNATRILTSPPILTQYTPRSS